MSATGSLAVVGLLAIALGAAPAARAGVQLYQGTWVAQSFGNDVTNTAGGADESMWWEVLGIPLGNLCNAAFPACDFGRTGASVGTALAVPPGATSTPPLTAKKFDPLAAFCVQNVAFGLPATRPAKGGTAVTPGAFGRPIPPLYRNPAHFTTTTPSGGGIHVPCSDATTVLQVPGMPVTKKAYNTQLSTFDPQQGVGMKGAPLTGSGAGANIAGPDPRAFTISAAPLVAPTFAPNHGMRRTVTGSFSNFAPYLYSYTYAKLRGSNGYFSKGGGFFSAGAVPTTVQFPYVKGAVTVANSKVTRGANSFGGVMRLLGKMTNRVCYFLNGGCLLGKNNWRYENIGTSAPKAGGVVSQAATVMYSAVYYHTLLMQQSTVMATGSRFPWTTGTVTVTATGRGPNNTIEKRQGFDNRVNGVGSVQLVSPIITKWLQPSVNFETGGIAVLRLDFTNPAGGDTDSDAVIDSGDNCLYVQNGAGQAATAPSQVDGDGDSYGNLCDCDFAASTNGVCDGTDFLGFGGAFGSTVGAGCPVDVDLNGNTACDGPDFLIFGGRFGKRVGPSGLVP